jgi:membrane-bound metal-dependent hydrolase YbcI (DUF457 family)
MFAGHYAVALAAKRLAPRTSLGALFFGAQFLDLLWPSLLIAGLEHVRIDPGNTAYTPLDFYDYPVSHSLAAVLVWSALTGAAYFLFTRYRRGAQVIAACVASHWVLDFVTHRADLPLWPGGPRFGLGLWNSVGATIAVEAPLFAAGLFLYSRGTRARDKAGAWDFWSLAAMLTAIYAMTTRGDPPPNTAALAVVGNAAWLFVLWAWWADRHRTGIELKS